MATVPFSNIKVFFRSYIVAYKSSFTKFKKKKNATKNQNFPVSWCLEIRQPQKLLNSYRYLAYMLNLTKVGMFRREQTEKFVELEI